MNHMMEMTQIRHETLREEADMRRLAKLAKTDKQPHPSNHALSVGRILQMLLVMLK